MGVHASFRDVDAEAFREFKAAVAREGMRMGGALSQAMLLFVKKLEPQKRERKNFADIKPFDFGPGSEKLSTSVDEVLYGWKK